MDYDNTILLLAGSLSAGHIGKRVAITLHDGRPFEAKVEGVICDIDTQSATYVKGRRGKKPHAPAPGLIRLSLGVNLIVWLEYGDMVHLEAARE